LRPWFSIYAVVDPAPPFPGGGLALAYIFFLQNTQFLFLFFLFLFLSSPPPWGVRLLVSRLSVQFRFRALSAVSGVVCFVFPLVGAFWLSVLSIDSCTFFGSWASTYDSVHLLLSFPRAVRVNFPFLCSTLCAPNPLFFFFLPDSHRVPGALRFAVCLFSPPARRRYAFPFFCRSYCVSPSSDRRQPPLPCLFQILFLPPTCCNFRNSRFATPPSLTFLGLTLAARPLPPFPPLKLAENIHAFRAPLVPVPMTFVQRMHPLVSPLSPRDEAGCATLLLPLHPPLFFHPI